MTKLIEITSFILPLVLMATGAIVLFAVHFTAEEHGKNMLEGEYGIGFIIGFLIVIYGSIEFSLNRILWRLKEIKDKIDV